MSEKLANKKDVVTVFGTGLSQFIPKGVESAKINRVAAEKLVASGKATYKKAKDDKKQEPTA